MSNAARLWCWRHFLKAASELIIQKGLRGHLALISLSAAVPGAAGHNFE